VPHQRRVNRGNVFFTGKDRLHYLQLLKNELLGGGSRVISYCLVTNHLHLVVIPERADSLGRYLSPDAWPLRPIFERAAQSHGHLWQNRFYSTMLSASHLWVAIGYGERNPVRARMVEWAEEYR
jgi:putative transposase